MAEDIVQSVFHTLMDSIIQWNHWNETVEPWNMSTGFFFSSRTQRALLEIFVYPFIASLNLLGVNNVTLISLSGHLGIFVTHTYGRYTVGSFGRPFLRQLTLKKGPRYVQSTFAQPHPNIRPHHQENTAWQTTQFLISFVRNCFQRLQE